MKRMVTVRRLRAYAADYPKAEPSLDHWEKIVEQSRWRTPADVQRNFNGVDPVTVGSGRTVYVFNIQGNEHRLVAAIHFNSGMVFVLRLMTHKGYDRGVWKDQL